jgi:serine/threonine-protein kinase RsbW
MTATDRCLVEARMSRLPDATAFVEAFCSRHGVGHADGLRLTLVVEEMFTNTVEHGHGGDSTAPVRLELEARPDAIALLYEDNAPAFDGEPGAALARLDVPLGERPEGGLGLLLIRTFATSVRHVHEDGCNRWWIVLPRRA